MLPVTRLARLCGVKPKRARHVLRYAAGFKKSRPVDEKTALVLVLDRRLRGKFTMHGLQHIIPVALNEPGSATWRLSDCIWLDAAPVSAEAGRVFSQFKKATA